MSFKARFVSVQGIIREYVVACGLAIRNRKAHPVRSVAFLDRVTRALDSGGVFSGQVDHN